MPHPETLSLQGYNESNVSFQSPDGKIEDYRSIPEGKFALMCDELAHKIKADGHEFDAIVTMARGGLPLSRISADIFKVKEIYSIGIKSEFTPQRRKEPTIYQELGELAAKHLAGKRVLFLDEIGDDGKSLQLGLNHLKQSIEKAGGNLAKLITCCLLSKDGNVCEPDYFLEKIPKSLWVIFYYEAKETIEELLDRWAKYTRPLNREEKRQRFLRLGLSERDIEESLLEEPTPA